MASLSRCLKHSPPLLPWPPPYSEGTPSAWPSPCQPTTALAALTSSAGGHCLCAACPSCGCSSRLPSSALNCAPTTSQLLKDWVLTALRWAPFSPTQYPVYRRGEGTQECMAWPPQTNSDTQMHPDHPSLPPSASSLRTELGNRDHHAGWLGLRQISICGTHLRAKHCHVTTESTCPGCDTFHPTAMSAWTVFLDSQVSLGHRHLTIGGVPAGRAPAPVAQALLQLCLHLRTWQEALCVTCGTSLWSLTLCGLTTLLVSSLSALPDFRFRNLMIKLPRLAENNVTGFAPSPTNHRISHVSKEVSGRLPECLPVVGEGGPTVLGLRKPSTRPTVTKQNHNCLKSALLQLQTPGVCM